MAAEEERREDRLEDDEVFRRNGFMLIMEMLEMSTKTQKDTSMLVDEILHSILFLGHISFPPFTPKSLLDYDDDNQLYELFRKRHPKPFNHYSSQLPRRSPFSCVLDMIVHLTGQENEKEIKLKLQDLICKLKVDTSSKILLSSTMCISRTANSARYYGVSMSTFGRPAGRIMVAASCFSNTLDDYVADAVITYGLNHKEKKKYFDGTFQLPPNVTCQAFNISRREPMPPCRSCGNLFGLKTDEKRGWPYGNCAEVESVSNLLKNEKQVRHKVGLQRNNNLLTVEGRQRAKEHVLKELKTELKEVSFEWNEHFYTPQGANIIEDVQGDV